jgi:hypothetical protein
VIEGLVLGVALGIVIGLLIARIRQAGLTTEGTLSAKAGVTRTEALPGRPGPTHHPLHFTHQVVKRRIETRITPEGLTIGVDGAEYHRLADIPDRETADEVREALAMALTTVTDPAAHATLEAELRGAGVELAEGGPT